MVWFSILAVLVLQGVGNFLFHLFGRATRLQIVVCPIGCWYCWTRYVELKNFPSANQTLAQIAFTTNLDTYLKMSETWLAFLIILGVSMVIIILMLIFLRNRIRIAIALIGHASKSVYIPIFISLPK